MSLPLRNKQSGFTLVEALVSMTLLTVGLIPVFWMSTQALSLSLSVKNTMIASNLAQEGLELTRAIRDTNWLLQKPTSWDGMNECSAPVGCEIAFDDPVLRPVGGPPRFLSLAPATGLYQYSNGQQTVFTRVITIGNGATSGERIVTSRVSWTERKRDRNITLEYHLFDWLK